MDVMFEVGERYRNRNGEYDVVELNGEQMVIQYVESGEQLPASRGTQERIWMNICTEERMEEERNAPKPAKGKRKAKTSHSASKGSAFQGLGETDFQDRTTGTTWRNRGNLGGLLARRMTDRSSVFFESYPVFRQPMVNIARPDHYGQETKWREAKFFFKLNPERASFGWCIERGNVLLDDSWDWPRFLRALRDSETLRTEVEGAMSRLDLHWEWYVREDGGLIAKVFQEGDAWSWEGVNGEGKESIPWDGFIDRLESADEQKWYELYLCRDMDKDEALKLGPQLIEPVTDAFSALVPLYLAAIGEAEKR
jgi:hypothetical protein